MEPVTFYRLGQIRHMEILAQAEQERQHPLRVQPVSTAPIGRLLLAWGARLVGTTNCTNVATGRYTVTVCSAQSA